MISALVCMALVFTADRIPRFAGRAHDLTAVQSMHDCPTPRVGGIAIFIAFLVSTYFVPVSLTANYVKFAAATGILFAVGLAEDLGFNIAPKARLAACLIASLAVIVLLDTWLPRIGIPSFDPIMASWAIGVPITLVITAAVANGFNLIDGVNGLAALTAIAAAGALATISHQAGYLAMTDICLLLAAGILGFLVLNYPFGLIFLGDAGAYTLGFILSWFGISILLQATNASPWAILLTVFWPLADTLLAIYRRLASSTDTFAPDRLHVHQMVMRSLEIYFLGRHQRHISNPLTTLILAPFVVAPPLSAIFLWDQNRYAFFAVITFVALFFSSYRIAIIVLKRLPHRSGCPNVAKNASAREARN